MRTQGRRTSAQKYEQYEEKLCISVKSGSVGLLGNGYAEIESKLWFSQKGFNGIRDITSWGSGFYRE